MIHAMTKYDVIVDKIVAQVRRFWNVHVSEYYCSFYTWNQEIIKVRSNKTYCDNAKHKESRMKFLKYTYTNIHIYIAIYSICLTFTPFHIINTCYCSSHNIFLYKVPTLTLVLCDIPVIPFIVINYHNRSSYRDSIR